jgi:hypothetical protein
MGKRTKKSLVGERFGDLSVVEEHVDGLLKSFYKCRCLCGHTVLIKKEELHRKKSSYEYRCRHTGLTKVKIKHGATNRQSPLNPTYRSWENLRARCLNIKSKDYPNYGGRGIKVCREWNSFENFFDDMGIRPEGTTIGRIDNDGPYCKENCRWETPKQQQNNTRYNVIITNLTNNSKTILDLSEITGLTYNAIELRVRRGASYEDIINTPFGERRESFLKDFSGDIGKRNGKLVVEKIYKEVNTKGVKQVVYDCKCDCGGLKTVVRGNFTKTFSCGCLKSVSAKERCARIKQEKIAAASKVCQNKK